MVADIKVALAFVNFPYGRSCTFGERRLTITGENLAQTLEGKCDFFAFGKNKLRMYRHASESKYHKSPKGRNPQKVGSESEPL